MESIVKTVWTKSKMLIKGLIIAAIILLLQIPAYYVQGLVEERAGRQQEAINEVSSKWAGRQDITGPVLVLPYIDGASDSAARKDHPVHFASFLPDELNVHADVTPIEKYRGIYKVMLYTSKVSITGNFNGVDPSKLNIPPSSVLWNQAFVKVHLADIKGLNEELKMNINNRQLSFAVDPASGDLAAALPLSGPADLSGAHFSSDLNLSGAEQLLFTPLGRSTSVQVNSSWPNPSFTGDILPQTSQVHSTGFTANWKSMAYKRFFPQQWRDNEFVLSNNSDSNAKNIITHAAFGTDLFVPVNNYQKSMRSAKYAFLCILLTFAAFFLIETTQQRSVHPFQYGLIGLAMVLFYTLLLSFSEYTGFGFAYLIASLFTISLIAWFVKTLLGAMRSSVVLSSVLVLLYLYVFIILQLQDYALILGSLGLFAALAVVMKYSRKIQW